jgi:transcriptional regulator with XRE-family HTH domain
MDLKAYLDARGLSDTQFAVEIGVSLEAVRRYRQGARFPKPSVMRRIMEVTKGAVTPNDFLPIREAAE